MSLQDGARVILADHCRPIGTTPYSLVGLLSFMCSDDMTTGSIMATAADRGVLAERSHAFNISQPRFKKMFPEYSKEKHVDLPNMGEIKKEAEKSQSSKQSEEPASSSSIKREENKDGPGNAAGKVWTLQCL